MIPNPKSNKEIMEDSLNEVIFEECKANQSKSNAKNKVGAVVEAREYREDGTTPTFRFNGTNIHISDSFGDTHAERMAIDNALREKCYPITVYVTSNYSDEDVLLCGSCRHYISEINENCNIVVFNPNGTIKMVSTIKEAYPYRKDVKEKNIRIFESLGGYTK